MPHIGLFAGEVPSQNAACLADGTPLLNGMSSDQLSLDVYTGINMSPAGTIQGPDLIVGDISGLAQFGSSGTQVGLAAGTEACNAGNVDLGWFALPNSDHPVLPQNLYRLSGGASGDERFEQIGQSSVVHAFSALAANGCSLGCNGVGGNHLGSGCSSSDTAGINSGPNLGSRAWINPFTGVFPGSNPNPNDHIGHVHNGVSHRIITEVSDLNTSLNQGATYYAEAQYITPGESTWCQSHAGQCNMYDNVSYRRFSVTGTTTFNFSAVGSTVRTEPAIDAWPGATLVQIEPDPGNDGIGVVGYKVTNPSPGVFHYEYAVYNENLDRAIQSFSMPLGNAVSNVGFHAPPQHPGWTGDGTVGNAGYSSVPWSVAQTANTLSWSCETFAQNPNANAIRWGTLYNFRFDSEGPPTNVSATVGFYKNGEPIQITVPGPGPGTTTTPTAPPTTTPSNTPTATSTNTPTDTPTNTPTATATHTPTNTPTSTATNTPTATATNASTATATNTTVPTPSASETHNVTSTPTSTATNTPTASPSCTPGWSAGPDLNPPIGGTRAVGVYFPPNGRFYAVGGRSIGYRRQ